MTMGKFIVCEFDLCMWVMWEMDHGFDSLV